MSMTCSAGEGRCLRRCEEALLANMWCKWLARCVWLLAQATLSSQSGLKHSSRSPSAPTAEREAGLAEGFSRDQAARSQRRRRHGPAAIRGGTASQPEQRHVMTRESRLLRRPSLGGMPNEKLLLVSPWVPYRYLYIYK